MNLTSRKVMSYFINTALLLACFIYFAINAPYELISLFDTLVYSQLFNTGLLLGANYLDKKSWITANVSNGKKSMEVGK